MPSNKTPLYFFSWNIIYFDQKEPSNVQILRLSSARVKICQIPHVDFETASQSSDFASFFIAMTNNSPVSFKLLNFLL